MTPGGEIVAAEFTLQGAIKGFEEFRQHRGGTGLLLNIIINLDAA